MNDTIETTDDIDEKAKAAALAEAKLRAWRCKKALQSAPELVEFMRSMVARAERGESLPEAVVPLQTGIVQDADDLYTRLVEWVTYWHRLLVTLPPATTPAAWKIWEHAERTGLPAGVTPRGASALVQLQTMWLLQKQHQIQLHPSHETYQADIIKLLSKMRAAYPVEARREKPTFSRACPTCGEFTVTADWWSPRGEDVDVKCEHCGWSAEYQTVVQKLDWIDEPDRELASKRVRFTTPARKGRIHLIGQQIQQIREAGITYRLVPDLTGQADYVTEQIEPETEPS
jgi:predicted RNA-binding Zn-ribbon protein involved in translation (DUF1610 family)